MSYEYGAVLWKYIRHKHIGYFNAVKRRVGMLEPQLVLISVDCWSGLFTKLHLNFSPLRTCVTV